MLYEVITEVDRARSGFLNNNRLGAGGNVFAGKDQFVVKGKQIFSIDPNRFHPGVIDVITSYSIHYTKLYETQPERPCHSSVAGNSLSCRRPMIW